MKKIKILALVLFACLILDQSTKYIAKHYLEGRGVYSYVGDTFRLVYSENTGAFLGLGASLPERVRTFVFSGLVALFLAAFLVYTIRSPHVTRTGFIASALIIGGGLGNLIDRLVNNGAVMDFMNVGIGSLRTGIFNIADMAIMLGAVLLLWYKDDANNE
jgi:signal peptidase II